MATYLITGIAGFIGSHLAHALVTQERGDRPETEEAVLKVLLERPLLSARESDTLRGGGLAEERRELIRPRTAIRGFARDPPPSSWRERPAGWWSRCMHTERPWVLSWRGWKLVVPRPFTRYELRLQPLDVDLTLDDEELVAPLNDALDSLRAPSPAPALARGLVANAGDRRQSHGS